MIRIATKKDIEKLVKIEKESFSVEPWTKGMFFDSIITEHTTIFVYEEYFDIIAFVVLSAARFCDAEIQNLAVRKGHRRRGLGKLLLNYAIEQANKKYCYTMFLEVGVKNIAAQTLYKNCGFEIISTRKDYYGTALKGKNAFVMRRKSYKLLCQKSKFEDLE